MKKSIKAIAAASAALAMAFSCVPVTFAAKDVPAVQTETEPEAKKTGVTFEERDPVEVPSLISSPGASVPHTSFYRPSPFH